MAAPQKSSQREFLRGEQMHQMIEALYPICRSITGDGVRQTLRMIAEEIPLRITEIPTGTEVLDWTVPKEWNIREAWIQGPDGKRVVDFQDHNLHVVSYSLPIRATMSLEELSPHLHSLPDHPDWVPYRTSYYNENWGFCLTDRARKKLRPGQYEVCIDSTLSEGSLTYAECVVPGRTPEEIVLTAHVCHPSLCNDNLSGIAVATALVKLLQLTPRRYTVRVLFIPGTIGSICWLAQNQSELFRIRAGMSLVCLGDSSKLCYKKSLQGDAEIDRVMAHALHAAGEPYEIIDYFPYGYDERQFNSPGFNLPFGSLMRGQHGQFPEYHTSGDNLDFVTPEQLEKSLEVCMAAISMFDDNRCYKNLRPYGEPQLGKRGVYRALGGTDIADTQLAIFWVLALSNGERSLLDIAVRSGLGFSLVRDAASLLERQELLSPMPPRSSRLNASLVQSTPHPRS